MARKSNHKHPSHDPSTTVDKRLQELLFKDALQYSAFMCNQAYQRLHADLLFLSRGQENKPVFDDQSYETQVSAMTHAWQVIDSVHRIRTLLSRGPRLMRIPTRDLECRLFMEQTNVVEQMRHTIQHLDSTIFDFIKLRLPVWGSLSWLAKLDDGPGCLTCTLIPGAIFKREAPIIHPGGVTFTVPIGSVMLTSTAEANLSDIGHVQIPRLADWLNKTTSIDCSQRAQCLLLSLHVLPQAATDQPET